MDEAQSYQHFTIIWNNLGFWTIYCDGVPVAREWHTEIIFGMLQRQTRNIADSRSGTYDHGQCV